MDRRRFLGTVGAAVVIGLAGCNQPDPDGTVTRMDTVDEETTASEETTVASRTAAVETTTAPGTTATGSTSQFGDWFASTDNFDGVVDRPGQPEVSVTVGAEGNGGNLAFEPAAVRVDVGTTVVWEWTGEGGQHNVAEQDQSFSSEISTQAGFTYSHPFETAGTVLYLCVPHRSVGMRGAVVVE